MNSQIICNPRIDYIIPPDIDSYTSHTEVSEAINQLPLNETFYMEGSKAISVKGSFEIEVDNFELLLSLLIDTFEK